jgi:ABC-type multidrug transport system fused ATPase/permease subunit
VLGAIPVIVLPLVAFGRSVRRRSRTAHDTLADASAYAAELIGAIRTLQAFTNEPAAGARFGSAVERAYGAALQSTKARAVLTAIIIFLASASVVVILWVGAQDVIAGHMTPGTLSQFVLFAIQQDATGTGLLLHGLVGLCWGVAIVRFGLLAAVAFQLVRNVIASYPFTLDLERWYAWSGLVGVLVVLA